MRKGSPDLQHQAFGSLLTKYCVLCIPLIVWHIVHDSDLSTCLLPLNSTHVNTIHRDNRVVTLHQLW